MLEFIWSTLFSKAVDIATKKMGRVRFEASDFSAEIEKRQDPNDCVVVIDPYAPSVGDLDLSLGGAFFYDNDGASALSQFSFAFKAADSDATNSVLAEATSVVAFPNGRKAGADYTGRINLPSRQFVEIQFRSSVPKASLALLDGCDSLYLSAMVGSKRRRAWKVAEKRDGQWQKAAI